MTILLKHFAEALNDLAHNAYTDIPGEHAPKHGYRYVGVRTTPKIPRNSLCPCNSGRKYKHCCGGNK